MIARRRIPGLIGGILLGLTLTGCVTTDPGATPQPARYLVVERTTSGGYCANACPHTRLRIYSDRSYSVITLAGTDPIATSTGSLDESDWGVVAAAAEHPEGLFTAKPERFCNSAVDGIDVDYSLVNPSGDRRAYSSCTHDFAPGSDFFRLMQSLGAPSSTAVS